MLKMSEYAKRRTQLMKKIGPADVVILPAAHEVIRNNDTHYPYRQQSDFYYLTGFEEPQAVLVLAPNRKEGEYLLFNRVRDRDSEIWNGPRAGQEGACREFLADAAYPIDQFTTMLPELLAEREAIHYPLGSHWEFDKLLLQGIHKVRAKIRSGLQSPIAFFDITHSLHEMRLFKTKAEIALLQHAVDITEKAHIRVMRECKPGMFEYQLEACLTYEFQQGGARFPAYLPIVGSGSNTCILHYVNNNQKIVEGSLVLVDAGAEYQNYAADITRTFPANGRFSAEQRAIYEIVLKAQLAAIESIRPGTIWTTMQAVIINIITQGLLELGILQGNLDDLIEKQACLPFYMHRSGHWLGLDVHDAGRYCIHKEWRLLEPTMVLTVEPGIYIAADIKGVHPRWHNIGVRIEDDVLVTEEGCRVLSQKIPKTISDIEAVMAK